MRKIPKGYRAARLGEDLSGKTILFNSKKYYDSCMPLTGSFLDINNWTKDNCRNGFRFDRNFFSTYKILVKK